MYKYFDINEISLPNGNIWESWTKTKGIELKDTCWEKTSRSILSIPKILDYLEILIQNKLEWI